MIKVTDKKRALIQALTSRNKETIKKALSFSMPEKWFTIILSFEKKTITYLDQELSESAMQTILDEAAIDYQINIMALVLENIHEGPESYKWDFYDKLIARDCKNISLIL